MVTMLGLKSVLFSWLVVYNLGVNSFNLDTQHPRIKRGPGGSYFGFSVAFHEILGDQYSGFKSLILVGAPVATNLQPNASSSSGGLFACSIESDDCWQIRTDGISDLEWQEGPLSPPGQGEIKEDQWMGVTVRAERGSSAKVLVCGHRFVRAYTVYSNTSYTIGGLCYILLNNLSLDEIWEPCLGLSRSSDEYGFCQAGTSGDLIEDLLVVSAPGTLHWRGEVFAKNVSNDYLGRDAFTYRSKDPYLASYSYSGHAVVAGRMRPGGEVVVVVGAPRGGDGVGLVTLYSLDRSSASLLPFYHLQGHQLTSNFGYSLATVDFNSDGEKEIVVGAPMWFSGEAGGKVYIYKHFEGSYQLWKTFTGAPESRFGTAIASLGDLNEDGFEDLAVGAPYDREGTIYIYFGSELEPTQRQVVRGKDVQSDLLTFGYSLSGGLDIDGNGYPDLLVGAFESSSVVLLRARQIVDVTTRVADLPNIDPTVKGCPDYPQANLTCFRFEVCFSMETNTVDEEKLRQRLTLTYKLKADVKNKISRVFFWKESRKSSLEENIDVTLKPDEDVYSACKKYLSYLSAFSNDYLQPIEFAISEIKIEVPRNERDVIYPVIDFMATSYQFKVNFLKDCGDDDICESQIQFNAALYFSKDDAVPVKRPSYNEVLVYVTVKNSGDSAYNTQIFIVFPEKLKYIRYIEQSGRSDRCDPDTKKRLVVCQAGNPLRRDESTTIGIYFDISVLYYSGELDKSILVTVNSTSLMLRPQKTIPLTVRIPPDYQLIIKGKPKPVEVLYEWRASNPNDLKNKSSGVRDGSLSHVYQIFNDGMWDVHKLAILIDWPAYTMMNTSIGTSEDLLSIEAKDDIKWTCISQSQLKSASCDRDSIQRRNTEFKKWTDASTEPVPPGPIDEDLDPEQYPEFYSYDVVINKMIHLGIFCVIENLPSLSEVTLTLNESLCDLNIVEEFFEENANLVCSKVQVNFVSRLQILRPEGVINNENYVGTKLRVVCPAVSRRGFPWLVLLLSAAAGFLILLILSAILWKLNFFKRLRPRSFKASVERPGYEDSSKTLLSK